MKTPQQKALDKIDKHAITALKQRFSGATPRQREAIKAAAEAHTADGFGSLVWIAFHKSERLRKEYH